MQHIDRHQFADLIRSGRILVAAYPYERQDYMVTLSDNPFRPFNRPYRDITDEPEQSTRAVHRARITY